MSTVSLQELADNAEALLSRLQGGERIVVVRDGRAVAELRPIAVESSELRPIGLAAGQFVVPDDFDAPLPDIVIQDFEG